MTRALALSRSPALRRTGRPRSNPYHARAPAPSPSATIAAAASAAGEQAAGRDGGAVSSYAAHRSAKKRVRRVDQPSRARAVWVGARVASGQIGDEDEPRAVIGDELAQRRALAREALAGASGAHRERLACSEGGHQAAGQQRAGVFDGAGVEAQRPQHVRGGREDRACVRVTRGPGVDDGEGMLGAGGGQRDRRARRHPEAAGWAAGWWR